MNKKNDKRLCWNCDGDVSQHLNQCPYCGVDLLAAPSQNESQTPFRDFASPFQRSSQNYEDVPQPPYARTQEFAVTDEEWQKSLDEEEGGNHEESGSYTTKKELVALLLLLPGIVFLLFGAALFFFSKEGVLVLRWNQGLASFYLVGAVPLIYLGWRALR